MTTDEFAFLADEAAEVGASGPLPVVRREAVPTDAGAVSALVWGAAPRLTLLHGAGLNAHTWDATLLRLGRPALAVDLPGHGDSDWREDFDYAPRTNAPAVAAVIDALAGSAPQTIVGQSLGGATAIAVAEHRPDLVEALVIVDISPGLRPEDAQQVRGFLSGPLVFESRQQLADLAVSAGIAQPGPALDRGVLHNTRVRDDGSVVFKHHLGTPPPGASLDVDYASLWAPLESSDVPVLLVRATSGFLPPDVVAEFGRRVPRARIVEVESGHNVQEQKPAELADLIADFLG